MRISNKPFPKEVINGEDEDGSPKQQVRKLKSKRQI
jgi:hypothetical protein